MRGELSITIRPLQAADYESLARFFDENNRPEITRHFHPFALSPETARELACAKHSDRYYIALRGAAVVALSMLRGWDEGYEVPSFGVIVDHRLHNRGVGARMTEFTLGEARRLGCARVRLSVFASNPAAVRVYAARGFVETGREPVAPAGEPDEKIVMLKEL
jgi:ribosomal-protein-alanine N-acetyltransferase